MRGAAPGIPLANGKATIGVSKGGQADSHPLYAILIAFCSPHCHTGGYSRWSFGRGSIDFYRGGYAASVGSAYPD